EPHWHHDVARVHGPRCMDQAAAVRVRQANLDLVAINGAEGVEEVIDVEADLHFLALVGDLDLVLGFLLFGVVCLDGKQVGAGGQANATILFVGEDGGALQCLTQGLAVSLYQTRWTGRDDASVLRETSVNQLRSEANVADLGANVISTDRELDVTLSAE